MSKRRRWAARRAFFSTSGACPCRRRCGCPYDGVSGSLCEQPTEMFCVNQCGGHGECVYGFCKCHAGWYGADCSRKAAGQEMEPGERAHLRCSDACSYCPHRTACRHAHRRKAV